MSPLDDDLSGNDAAAFIGVPLPGGEVEGDAAIASAPGPLERRSLLGSLIGLAALLFFQALLLGSWISRDTAPPAWDQSIQMETAIDAKAHLAAGDWKGLMTMAPKPGMPPFPPLYHLTIQFAFGSSDPAHQALWVNWFYLALLCFSLWGLGRHFSGNWAGLGAAVVFSCVPEVQWLMRENLLDLALTAWVAAAYCSLALSDDFRKKVPAVLTGVFAAAAMLTKWSAFSYFFPVLWFAGKAWKTKSGRIGAGLAFAVFAVLVFPWYYGQWAVVLPRLFTASADNAVPLLGLGAFQYFIHMSSGFDLPFFVLGLVSFAAPSVRNRKGDSSLLLSWFGAALIFWTIVPNRQLRYLLPGLAPLAVLVMGPWPKKILIGLCAYQLLTAVNYGFGAIPNVNLGSGLPVSFFRSQPPLREDWKIGEILKEAGARHEKGTAFGNLTLVANHQHFNGPTFNWERKRHGVGNIRIRGVNRRLCEFSEFVVIKTGSLGPVAVVNQLPEVQRLMLDEDAWFQRGYQKVKRWELPDGTGALLYQRRKFPRVVFGEQTVTFQYYEDEAFVAENLKVRFGEWDDKSGVYPAVRLTAPRIVFRGLEVRNLDIEMRGLSFVTVADPKKKGLGTKEDLLLDLRLLRMSRLILHAATISEGSAAAFLQARAGSDVSAVRFKFDGTIAAALMHKGRPAAAEVAAALLPGDKGLEVSLKGASYAGISLPLGLIGPYRRYVQSFEPNPELPFQIRVKDLKIAGGQLVIGH